jgi:hypothetical protein
MSLYKGSDSGKMIGLSCGALPGKRLGFMEGVFTFQGLANNRSIVEIVYDSSKFEINKAL